MIGLTTMLFAWIAFWPLSGSSERSIADLQVFVNGERKEIPAPLHDWQGDPYLDLKSLSKAIGAKFVGTVAYTFTVAGESRTYSDSLTGRGPVLFEASAPAIKWDALNSFRDLCAEFSPAEKTVRIYTGCYRTLAEVVTDAKKLSDRKQRVVVDGKVEGWRPSGPPANTMPPPVSRSDQAIGSQGKSLYFVLKQWGEIAPHREGTPVRIRAIVELDKEGRPFLRARAMELR